MSNEIIRIALKERKLYLYRGDARLNSFPIAVGKPATPTPVGEFEVIEKRVNPGGVLGSRWLGFHIVWDGIYGIHGTTAPELIGGAVSLGCVRMNNADIEFIFPLVPIGAKITISQLLPGDVGRTYTVLPGDSIWKIAKKAGIEPSLLISVNDLHEPYLLQPGQVLVLP